MTSDIITVSTGALAHAVETERVGQLHPVLRATAEWVDPDEQATPDPHQELSAGGLLDGRGRVSARLFDLLPCLCAPSVEYLAYRVIDGRRYTALVAAHGTGAVLAVREGETVRIREIARDYLIDALINVLELQPGTGPLVGVNVDKLREDNDAILQRATSYEVTQLRAMLSRPLIDGIEVTVGVRDEQGRYTTTADQLHIAEVDWGHFLTYTTGTGRDEELWGGPATRENVHTAITALSSTLPSAPRRVRR
ncbi:MAG: ESX secretion-associated protein EspG [Haloechinothrix sp.]